MVTVSVDQQIHATPNPLQRIDEEAGSSSEEEDTFEENPTLEAEYVQFLAHEAEKMKARSVVVDNIINSLKEKLPTVVPGPQGGSWLEVCGSHRQGTLLSDSNVDVMICFENDEVLPTQTIVDMLNAVVKSVESNEIAGFKVKSQVKFQKQFRLKHIVLEYQGEVEVSVQVECRLKGQPEKTPGRAVGDDCINRVIALDQTGRCRDYIRLMKLWSKKHELHGTSRMFNSSVEVLMALHTCQRLFLLPPLDQCRTQQCDWKRPDNVQVPSFCRFMDEFKTMILVFAREVLDREAFNMYVHFSAWKGSVTLDEATDKNHPPCEGRFRLYMENPAIHFVNSEDSGIPAPTGNLAREITNAAWVKLLELCNAPENMLKPIITSEEAELLRPQENRIITPEEGKRLGKKRRKKARTDKVKEQRRLVAEGVLPESELPPSKPRKRTSTAKFQRAPHNPNNITPSSAHSSSYNSPYGLHSPGTMIQSASMVSLPHAGHMVYDQNTSPHAFTPTTTQWASPLHAVGSTANTTMMSYGNSPGGTMSGTLQNQISNIHFEFVKLIN